MDEAGQEKISRTQEKKKALELQKLGERLVALGPTQVRRLELPGKLEEAVLAAMSMTRHGARRRQMQYIGALMRAVDPELLIKALAGLDMAGNQAAEAFQKIEAWRDRMVQGDDTDIERFMEAFPGADRQRLRQLCRNAAAQTAAGKPPAAARALFRYIRELSETGEA